jgi:AAA+ superfamily predicted ATPase
VTDRPRPNAGSITPDPSSGRAPRPNEPPATRPGARPAPAASPPAPLDCTPAQRELEVLIRARYPLLYVVSWEEERVEQQLAEIARARNKRFFVWTCTQGIVKYGAAAQQTKGSSSSADPLTALDAVINQVDPAIFLFKDFHPFLEEHRSNLTIIRRLRDVAYHLRDTYKTIVFVAPMLRLPPELAKDITVLEFGLPGPTEFNRLLDRIIDDLKDKPRICIDLQPAGRERLLQAARGLTLKEAENVFAKTIVLDGKLDASDVSVVFSEKQQIIRKSGLLEYYETQEQLENVAGLEKLKDWLVKRGLAFSDRAAEFGLPAPRGVMLLGVQGCGKSMCAKAASSLWKLPLLRLDIGRMFGSLVGSSEENMRRAIHTAESIAPAVLWVDEIDKAFGGAANSGGSDGGTATRVFGTFLTWLSEKCSPVFVIATANDISQLPPEMLRKGRLDEIFFVDLPSERERREVFRIHLARRGRQPETFDLDDLARRSDGFSGAEIEEAIISALYDAFSGQTELDQETLRGALVETVPLSKTMSEDLSRLRSWAHGRARPASGDETVAPGLRRKIEL